MRQMSRFLRRSRCCKVTSFDRRVAKIVRRASDNTSDGRGGATRSFVECNPSTALQLTSCSGRLAAFQSRPGMMEVAKIKEEFGDSSRGS